MTKKEAWETALALIAEDLVDYIETRFDNLIFESEGEREKIREQTEAIVNGIYNRAYMVGVTKIEL